MIVHNVTGSIVSRMRDSGVSRNLPCVPLPPCYGLGRGPERRLTFLVSCKESVAKPGGSPRIPDPATCSSVLHVFAAVGEAVENLISYSLRCDTCQSSLLWGSWWVLLCSAIPCYIVQCPPLTPALRPPSQQVSWRATFQIGTQILQCPSDVLPSTSASPAAFP